MPNRTQVSMIDAGLLYLAWTLDDPPRLLVAAKEGMSAEMLRALAGGIFGRDAITQVNQGENYLTFELGEGYRANVRRTIDALIYMLDTRPHVNQLALFDLEGIGNGR